MKYKNLLKRRLAFVVFFNLPFSDVAMILFSHIMCESDGLLHRKYNFISGCI